MKLNVGSTFVLLLVATTLVIHKSTPGVISGLGNFGSNVINGTLGNKQKG